MNDLSALLGRVPLFSSLSPDALAVLAARMRRRRLPDGSPVVYRGDPAGALYVILSGRVKIHTATSNGDEVILDVKGSGDFFGEMSLLDGRPRSADVSTLEETELALLDGDAMREAVEAQPKMAWALLRFLSVRLRDQNDQMEMQMTRDVAGRVAARLLHLAETQGKTMSNGKGVRIEVSLTQSDIAALVGATRERVSRALTTFRTQGAITWDKDAGRWVILNPTALRKRAEM